MRVAIWCSMVSLGGGARLLANILPALARQKDIELIRLVISSESRFKERFNSINYHKIEVIYYDGSIVSNQGVRLIGDINVVYFFWPHLQEYCPIDRPTVCTFHDATILDFVPPFMSGTNLKKYWKQSRIWLEKCTYVVVSSQFVKSSLISHFGSKLNSAVVIPHAILPSSSSSEQSISLDLKKRLPDEYIVYPANTSPHKNHYNLLLAYSRFSKRNRCPLVLVGYLTELLRKTPPDWPDISYIPTLVSLIKRSGLRIDENLYPLGFVKDSDIIPLIKNAKAVVMPSLSEGGGSYPVEEALRLGVPVLCSDIPVMREHLARHNSKVVWFNPEFPESIARALEEVMINYDKYKKAAINCQNDETETWDDIAKKYIQVFRMAYNKYYRK